MAGIQSEAGNRGAVYPSHAWGSRLQTRTGMVSARLSQNLSRNIATE
jgi:hypothetical protein